MKIDGGIQKDRKTLRIAFHHLKSLPRMKYNNQIITKRFLSVFEKNLKIINKQPYVKRNMDRRTWQTDKVSYRVTPHLKSFFYETLRDILLGLLFCGNGPGAKSTAKFITPKPIRTMAFCSSIKLFLRFQICFYYSVLSIICKFLNYLCWYFFDLGQAGSNFDIKMKNKIYSIFLFNFGKLTFIRILK